MLQVKNSAHAWPELPCSYTHQRRIWHVSARIESQQLSPNRRRARKEDSSSTGGPALVLIQVQVQS